jgi:hypothetical protein
MVGERFEDFFEAVEFERGVALRCECLREAVGELFCRLFVSWVPGCCAYYTNLWREQDQEQIGLAP